MIIHTTMYNSSLQKKSHIFTFSYTTTVSLAHKSLLVIRLLMSFSEWHKLPKMVENQPSPFSHHNPQQQKKPQRRVSLSLPHAWGSIKLSKKSLLLIISPSDATFPKVPWEHVQMCIYVCLFLCGWAIVYRGDHVCTCLYISDAWLCICKRK